MESLAFFRESWFTFDKRKLTSFFSYQSLHLKQKLKIFSCQNVSLQKHFKIDQEFFGVEH